MIEQFGIVVARVITNAKLCLHWSRLFSMPEDRITCDLSKIGLLSLTMAVKKRRRRIVRVCVCVCLCACVYVFVCWHIQCFYGLT